MVPTITPKIFGQRLRAMEYTRPAVPECGPSEKLGGFEIIRDATRVAFLDHNSLHGIIIKPDSGETRFGKFTKIGGCWWINDEDLIAGDMNGDGVFQAGRDIDPDGNGFDRMNSTIVWMSLIQVIEKAKEPLTCMPTEGFRPPQEPARRQRVPEERHEIPTIPPGLDLPVSAGIARVEEEAYNLVNNERTKRGLPPLVRDRLLDAVARAHSQDMADRRFFNHQNPDGKGPTERLVDAGIPYPRAGENIAYSWGFLGGLFGGLSEPARIAVEGWMGSPGHRDNILDASGHGYTKTGMGVAIGGDGSYYFTQLFFITDNDEPIIAAPITTPIVSPPPPPIIRSDAPLLISLARSDGAHNNEDFMRRIAVYIAGGLAAGGWNGGNSFITCKNEGCLDEHAEIIGQTGAFLVHITITGKNYDLKLEAFNTQRGVIAGIERSCDICTLSEALDAVRNAAEELAAKVLK